MRSIAGKNFVKGINIDEFNEKFDGESIILTVIIG